MSVNENETVETTEVNENETPVEEVEKIPAEDNKENKTQSSEEEPQTEEETFNEYTFGEEEAPPQEKEGFSESETQQFRDLRTSHKEKSRDLKKALKENEELKRQIEPQKEQITLAPKPKLEDFDYDGDEYEKALDNWHEQKDQVKAQEQENKKTLEAKQEKINKKVSNYTQTRQQYTQRFSDYEEVEQDVSISLGDAKTQIALSALEKPNDFVYAVGKNEAKLKELVDLDVKGDDIHSIIEFAAKLGKMETLMKKTKPTRTPSSKPEKAVNGGGSMSSGDAKEKKLLAKAIESGNMTEYTKYMKSKK